VKKDKFYGMVCKFNCYSFTQTSLNPDVYARKRKFRDTSDVVQQKIPSENPEGIFYAYFYAY